MEKSPFQKLSPELRNTIWGLALTEPDPIVFEENGAARLPLSRLLSPKYQARLLSRRYQAVAANHVSLATTRRLRRAPTIMAHALALVYTCKQVKSECGRLFVINNCFWMDFSYHYTSDATRLLSQLHLLRNMEENLISTIGPENTAVLCNVRVDLGAFVANHGVLRRGAARDAMVNALHSLEQCATRNPQWHMKADICLVNVRTMCYE